MRQGRVVVEGLVFDWRQDSNDSLVVWQWQCGRKSSQLGDDSPEATARTVARELIAEFDQRLAATRNQRAANAI